MLPVRIRQFEKYAELPDGYGRLLARASTMGFFHSETWFGFLMEHLWEGSSLRLYAVESANGDPLLLMPLRFTELDGAVPFAKTLASVGHSENYAVVSLVFDDTVDTGQYQEVLTALFATFRASQPPIDALRLWPLEAGSSLAGVVAKSLGAGGYWVQSYTNSFNRYEDTTGVSWESYLASRGSKQRYNIRRRRRNLENAGELEMAVYTGASSPDELMRGIDDYVLATVESWKSPGSMVSRPMLTLIRLAARQHCLRLGVLKFKGRPIAGQFWIVAAGVAHCMRIAYHEDYKSWAPGVVLTAYMLAHLLDEDKVSRIDFGLGEEEYKEKWMRDSRDYSGLMAFNPHTARGVLFASKHIAGQRVKRVLKPLLQLFLRPVRNLVALAHNR